MYCLSCKKQIPDDAIYCQWCGKKQIKSRATYHRRYNGAGTAYKAPSGTWTAEITLGYYVVNGKKKRKKRRKGGFKTKTDALRYLDKLPTETPKITISSLYERLDLDKLSKSKIDSYRKAWERVTPALAHRDINSLTADELQAAANVATTFYTRRDIKNLLSKIYQLAMRDDLTVTNKAQFIVLPEKETTERQTLTDENISRLWSDFNAEPCPVTAAALIMLYTGMRTGEIKALKAENVHISEHYLTGGIKTEKGKNRKIIIPDKIAPVLVWYLNAKVSTARNYLAEQWERKRADLGIDSSVTLYCCRHTYITKLTELNASPAMLQELAGHEDYDTTLNYTHLSIGERLDLVNRL